MSSGSTEILPKAAEATQLTAALRRAGVLGPEAVRDVTVESTRLLIMSRITRLRLTYDGAAPDAPRSVIVKTAHPDRVAPGLTRGKQEVAFYREVASAMTGGLVPRCFEAAWDAATGDWHLVLEDLAPTHATPAPWPLPPGEADCARIVAARARFHAAWWGDPRLGTAIGTPRSGAALEAFRREAARWYEQYAERFGDHLPAERRSLFERVLEAWPRLLGGLGARPDLTIVQGDAHVWNCFLPRDGGDDVRLFDWDGWRIDLGVTDIAHMMAIHWYPDRRRRLEQPLLDHYHRALLVQGVRGYDRAALGLDYRVSVLRQMMLPLWQAVHDIPPVVWWNNMERVLLAVDDLDCRALLD
jgi:hypothetical protein